MFLTNTWKQKVSKVHAKCLNCTPLLLHNKAWFDVKEQIYSDERVSVGTQVMWFTSGWEVKINFRHFNNSFDLEEGGIVCRAEITLSMDSWTVKKFPFCQLHMADKWNYKKTANFQFKWSQAGWSARQCGLFHRDLMKLINQLRCLFFTEPKVFFSFLLHCSWMLGFHKDTFFLQVTHSIPLHKQQRLNANKQNWSQASLSARHLL